MFEEAKEYFELLAERCKKDQTTFTEDELIKATTYLHELHANNMGTDKIMVLWCIAQKEINFLFALHPYIETFMVALVQDSPMPTFDYTREGLICARDIVHAKIGKKIS